MKPPAGYLIHCYDDDHFELDIPEQWETVLFPTLQDAVNAAWKHSRGKASKPLAVPLTGLEHDAEYNAARIALADEAAPTIRAIIAHRDSESNPLAGPLMTLWSETVEQHARDNPAFAEALEQERAAELKHEDAWAKALRLRKPAKGWRVGPDGKWTEV